MSTARDIELVRRGYSCGNERGPFAIPPRESEVWQEIIAAVDRMLGGDDRASDGEQEAEAGNLAQASPAVHPTPPPDPWSWPDGEAWAAWRRAAIPLPGDDGRGEMYRAGRAAAFEECAKIAEQVYDDCPPDNDSESKSMRITALIIGDKIRAAARQAKP